MTRSYRHRKSDERGTANHGWLKAKFSFSFSDYYDPDHMGYRSLRVINQDRIAAGGGFGTHPHSNMEIFTFVIRGELKHEDSMGNGRIIKAGEFQYMSAGAGVKHSEVNPSSEETELLQIWIEPNQRGGEPRYAELKTETSENGLTLFASPDGRDGSIAMRQDAEVLHGKIQEDIQVPASSFSGAWIQLIQGKLRVDDYELTAGDGLAIDGAETGFNIEALEPSEFLLFQL